MSEIPNFNDCVSIRDLTRYFAGEVSEEDRELIEQHLVECEFCLPLSERVAGEMHAVWRAELGIAELPAEAEAAKPLGEKISGRWKGIVEVSKGALSDVTQVMQEYLLPDHWNFRPAAARGLAVTRGEAAPPDVPITVLVRKKLNEPMVRISLNGLLLTVSILGYPHGPELPVVALVSGEESEPMNLPFRVVNEGDEVTGRELAAEARLPSEAAEFLVLLK